ncbi:MAG: CerR family C-terminal domain-containing protein [Deltaproteobacteria bacterium]|nr:CerR family C-terminal domain-containing protein [Deltaproteobacteria bacterium]
MARDSASTKERLLEAACNVFAAKGFRDATVAEICEEAGANIAAVNYHFRDKETLYAEAWRLAFQRSLAVHPPDGGVDEKAPAEERLRGRILSLVRRIVDPESLEFAIVHKELANPTGLLVKVILESLEPLRHALEGIVRELLGDGASQRQVQLCHMSIRGQCFDLLSREQWRKLFAKAEVNFGPPPLEAGIEAITDHITLFSMAGIRELRRRIENGELRERQ